MEASNWQMSRRQYGFALGILIAVAIHFPAPRALFAYAVAGGITALRFRTLQWKPSRAFIPFAIAAAGLALGALPGFHSKAGANVAHIWRFLALFVQAGMTLRAVIKHGPTDPISPKQKLAHDVLAKRRDVLKTLKDNRPLAEQHRLEAAKSAALNAELQAHIAEHGHSRPEEFQEILVRCKAQRAIVQPLGEELREATDRMISKTEDFKEAREAWKDRNKAA
jgi:hypothetical protein